MPPPSAQAELPPRPLPPMQADCCKGDCAPHCVFDVYERALERWQAACAEWQARNPPGEG